MGNYHTVLQGEYLSGIARYLGFASYLTIWDAPENKEIKDKRKNPNILLPGDCLFIPDKETKEETRATDKKHKFALEAEPARLRIKLMGLKNQPLEGHECTLVVEGSPKEIVTKADGILDEMLLEDVKSGKLFDRGKPGSRFRTQQEIPLKIGHLDPIDTLSGQIARLNNLGYNAGQVPCHTPTSDEEETLGKSPQFLSAVEEFQCDFDLAVDGLCGKKTQTKLLESHGS